MRLPKIIFVTNNTPLIELEKVAENPAIGVQIRAKDWEGRVFYEYALHARKKCSFLSINERLDVALATLADSIHLPENSLSLNNVKVLRKNLMVGASVHSLEKALEREKEGADYLFFGPIYETATKKNPQGLEKLASVCRSVSIPVYAIGGINLERMPFCLERGAYGVAAISAIGSFL